MKYEDDVRFCYCVGDTGLVGDFKTEEDAKKAAEKYMNKHGLEGLYDITGIVDNTIYPKYGASWEYRNGMSF